MKYKKLSTCFFLLILLFLLVKDASAQTSCAANISVTNSKNTIGFSAQNTFTITVNNTSNKQQTVDIVDEIWHDRNCDGIRDMIDCTINGLSSPCDWGVTNAGYNTWPGISLTQGETKTLTWQKEDWIPGFCFVHNVYIYSTPLDSTNPCWKGTNYGWLEATNGNLQIKVDQAKFSSFSDLPLLNGTAFGFNTFLDILGSREGRNNQDLAHFKLDIDNYYQQSSKIRIIRLAAFPWDYTTWVTNQSITWVDENLDILAEALNYANEKGFKIILVTFTWDVACAWNDPGTPDCWNKPYDETGYNDYVRRFYNEFSIKLNQRNQAANKIYLWNLWNETDQTCFSRLFGECINNNGFIRTAPPNYMNSDEYLDAFKKALLTAKNAIRSNSPNAKFTINVGSFPVNLWFYRTMNYFEKLQNAVDVLSVDLYPNPNDIVEENTMPNLVDYFRNKFKKPVFVLETGWPEWRNDEICNNGAKEDGQRSTILKNRFTLLNKHVYGALVYRTRDDYNNSIECPLWGIKTTSDNFKPSFYSLKDFVDANGIAHPPDYQTNIKFKIKLNDTNKNVVSNVQVKAIDTSGIEKSSTMATLEKVSDYYQIQNTVSFSNLPSGTYSLIIKHETTLLQTFFNVTLTAGGTLDCVNQTSSCGDFVQFNSKPLLSGDTDGFNELSGSFNKIDSADLEVLKNKFNTIQGGNTDFNLDGKVDLTDLDILGKNYNK